MVDKMSRKIEEGGDEEEGYETTMNCAVRCVEDNEDDDEAMSKRIQIVELLREAGGTAREIPREEWLAEQNEEMEATAIPED